MSINTNHTNFWKCIKNQRSKYNNPKTLTLYGAFSSNEQDAADMFASYFKSVYSSEVINDDVSNLGIPLLGFPNNVYLTDDDVIHGLSTLRGIKTIGPDGLSGEFLYQLRSIIAYPLVSLFRCSLNDGIFPSILKLCSVTPIPKSSNQTNITNYRPISVQSHLSKLFLVLNCIKSSVNNILIEKQHVFRQCRSTATCKLIFTYFVFEFFKKHSQVNVVIPI